MKSWFAEAYENGIVGILTPVFKGQEVVWKEKKHQQRKRKKKS